MTRMKFLAISTILFGVGFIVSSRVGLVSRLLGATGNERHEFTATLLTKAYDLEGRERTQEVATYAAKKDGSNVTIRKRFVPGASGQREVNLAEITDVPGRRIVGIDHFTKSTSTSPITDRMITKYTARPSSSCTDVPRMDGSTVETGPTDVVLGQRVLKMVQELQLESDGHRGRFETWYALDLNCFAVRTIATNSAPDGKVSRVVMEVTSLTPGEPNSSLFVVPETYTERSPSEIFAEADRLLGRTPSCTTCRAQTDALLDEAYRQRRKQQ